MKQLSSEALAALDAATIEGNALRLFGQLDRKVYLETNGALEALGGKWDRKAKAHLFEGDPSDALDQVLIDGTYHDWKKEHQQFFTPPELARRVVKLADVRGKTVFEPSAGEGALAVEALRQGATYVGCTELHKPTAAKLIAALGAVSVESEHRWTVAIGDFFEMAGGHCDRVIMNPPFARQQDIHHVLRAFDLMVPGGRLVAIMSAGVEFRQTLLACTFREAVKLAGGAIEHLPDDSFKESGTSVRTVLVTMQKPR